MRVHLFMSRRRLESQLRFEIQQIDKLFETYSHLLSKCNKIEPDIVELAAIASVLHSFYNGIENMILLILKNFDGVKFDQSQWHKELLINISKPFGERNSVISDDLYVKLTDYLSFRHFYRHSYSFILDWKKLKKLVDPLYETWKQVKDEMEIFLNNNS
jgi:hypothetical protein